MFGISFAPKDTNDASAEVTDSSSVFSLDRGMINVGKKAAGRSYAVGRNVITRRVSVLVTSRVKGQAGGLAARFRWAKCGRTRGWQRAREATMSTADHAGSSPTRADHNQPTRPRAARSQVTTTARCDPLTRRPDGEPERTSLIGSQGWSTDHI